jgi:hypothetical protein
MIKHIAYVIDAQAQHTRELKVDMSVRSHQTKMMMRVHPSNSARRDAR